jgi:hypothetical protein
MPKRSAAISILALALAAPWTAFAADLSVQTLDLISHGGLDSGTGRFAVDTRLYFDLAIKGGEKFGGLIRMDFLSGTVENDLAKSGQTLNHLTGAPIAGDINAIIDKINSLTSPRLRTAAVTARGLLGLPLEATYFVGMLDNFCSGDDFITLYGASPFSTALRGPMVYPEGVGGNSNLFYEGIHAVNGTGFRFGTTSKLSSGFNAYLYAYQDADIGPGFWSGDLRFLLNSGPVKLELFGGGSTQPGAPLGVYRAGMLFYAAPGEVGEFFAQAGIPRWDISKAFSVDELYFLFEPRINFGVGSLALTVFYHPAWYRQKETDEAGSLDAAFNLRFGKLAEQGAQGGVESLLELRTATGSTPLSINISPYYSVIAAGIEWDMKLTLKLFPFPSPWYGVFKPFIGLKTSF